MISPFTILTCVVTLLISLFLPVGILVYLTLRNKGKKLPSAWLLGAAGFFVTQMLIRIPILMVLSAQPWFVAFAQNHYFLYAFLLAFTAGLFELAGRFAVAKLLSKDLSYQRSLAAGLGHGGIEAMLLVGMTYISNLALILMINTGSFDLLLTQTAAAGVDVSQLELVRDTLINTSPILFLLGGFERILAMTAHAAMSLLVCYGVRSGKLLPNLLLCLGIHTLIDLTAGISGLAGSVLSQTAVYILVYSLLTVAAVISLSLIRRLRRCWTQLPA